MANWTRLRRQSHAPRELDGTETIYAAADGTLMHMDPDGSETELGSGGGGSGDVPFVGTDPPGSPSDGALWWDPDDDTPVNGGSQPVGCILTVNSFEIGAASVDYAVWDTIFDNAYDTNELEALPDGLGLSGFGTDTLTTDEAGVWAFTLTYGIGIDATWQGQMHFGNMNGTGHVNFPVTASGPGWLDTRSETLNLPAGASFSVGVATNDPPTADPFNSGQFSLQIVRLA